MNVSTITPLDAFRRRVQSDFFARLPEHVERLRWNPGRLAAWQRQKLRALLAFAITGSPFHARRLRGLDPATFDLSDLASLPVMTKADLMAHFDECLTDRRLDRDLVEDALAATTSEPVPLFDEYVALTTGGSSGQRGVFVHDGAFIAEFASSIIRSAVAAMGGSLPPGGITIGLVAAASAIHSTGMGPVVMAGSPVRFAAVPATLPLGEIVTRLNAVRPPLLFGYPTMLARLAREKQAGRLDIMPVRVTSTSENLTPELRAEIRSGFGVPVTNTFGATEGLVGSTAPDDPVFTFATDVCLVELVDATNRPVPPGMPSAKILVTNLANPVQPLIRYELADRFVRQPDVPDHGYLRATVEGRSDDVLRFGTIEIHPLVIRTVLVSNPNVLDYQVRQTARGIDVSLLADRTFDLEELRVGLREKLAAAGLPEAEVELRATDELERNPRTGKLARFLPLRAGS